MNTPYYLLHKELLDESIEKLNQARKQYWPNSIVGYSFKTNSLPWVDLLYEKTGILCGRWYQKMNIIWAEYLDMIMII